MSSNIFSTSPSRLSEFSSFKQRKQTYPLYVINFKYPSTLSFINTYQATAMLSSISPCRPSLLLTNDKLSTYSCLNLSSNSSAFHFGAFSILNNAESPSISNFTSALSTPPTSFLILCRVLVSFGSGMFLPK